MADLPRPFGRYVLLKSLGTGGTGDVFLARAQHGRAPAPIVIKRLHGQLASQPDLVKRFQHEAQIAVAIDSPHVAKVYDVGRVDETFYIAMEYVAGWTVSRVITDLIEAGGTASIASVADVIRGGLRGLTALHSARDPQTGEPLGIVHRDIAPKNLMIGEDGITRLIDLGLGKSALQDWRTGTGVVMGSPGYMAPEQVTAAGTDHRSDLYALGIVLWELLTLKRYIKRAPIAVMLRAQVKPSFVPPSKHRSDVPPELDAVCQRALQLEPADRFQSAGELLAALDAAVPPRSEEQPLATIVGAMLWGELGEAKTEVTKLLEVPAATAPAAEAVEVFAQRAPEAPPTPTPMAFVTQAPSPPAGVPPVAVLALMGLTLSIGLGIGALLLTQRDAEPVVVRAPPAVEARPIAVPEPEPEPEPERVEAVPPPAKAAPKLERAAKAEPAEPDLRNRAPEGPSDRERLHALMRRARALRRIVGGSDLERALTGLLAKAAQEASATEVNAKVLAELEAALQRLEEE